MKTIDKNLFDDISKILPKPVCEWTENDFPDLPNQTDNALNRVLQAYSRFLSRFSTSEKSVENGNGLSTSKTQKSTFGLLLKIGILVGDIIFVAYAVEVRRLQTEADITLLCLLAVLVVITILYLIFFVLMRNPKNLVSLIGIVAMVLICMLISVHPAKNEAPLLIKPYMSQMTNSELHAIMVNGFASIAGPVMVVYINFGIPANHLLIACVMSAPAALAIAKILYPETKQAPLAKGTRNTLHSSPFTNPIEAATVGALEAIPLCAGIIVNLMAFLSIFSVFNRILTWLGHRIGMSRKTIVISSYALCGFANVGSVGILLGTFIKMLPHRRKDLSGMVVHGMIGGTIAAFVTACFAGTQGSSQVETAS
ncbi:unnamed protein product [Hydatigera taeniaeformis]|uniref:Concentrative nucleoside transporter C-terminal domain-containing protein n=1 Tax=Hydatigena taeniaeformis TaxID=6205 RepID=A0A3P7F9Z6_HYDTA|nr:unnamed protein product [Hydatigera taeniaeformis]